MSGIPVEKAIVSDLEWLLDRAGLMPTTPMPCGVAFADLMTEQAIYEAKATLSTHNVLQAVGQVLMCREMRAHARDLVAVVVGANVPETPRLVEPARALGVELVYWRPNGYDLFTDNLREIERIPLLRFDRLSRKRMRKGTQHWSVNREDRWKGGEPLPLNLETRLVCKGHEFDDSECDAHYQLLAKQDRCGGVKHHVNGRWVPNPKCRYCDGHGRVKRKYR